MNNANFSPPSLSIPSRVLLQCPLCDGVFHTHMEFMNHELTTHPSLYEKNIILCSHVYAYNPFLTGNPPSTQPTAAQHVSLQNAILHSPLSASETFLQGNLSSAQHMAPQHASSQNIIVRSPIFTSNTFFLGNSTSTQPSAPQHVSSQINDGVVMFLTSSSNCNHPIRNDRTPAINRQQMTRRNTGVSISRGRAPPMSMLQIERRNEVGGSNSIFRNSNETISFGTRPLINQLDVLVSSNAEELVNIVEE
ncbi:hypothetical protein H5410_062036 [Solanum commersonii]|uniref:C2H2-type domain-containing protein n=1 Tax=Solanum commersonii TaxID=4109 RepID=A0A9J5WBE7_SOLCO|nr:hypothetical protein H5410_062036 [Solanum commersonii]